MIIGIDPGQQGYLVRLGKDRGEDAVCFPMPIKGEAKDIDFVELVRLLSVLAVHGDHVFLERAMPMAMGSKHAFNYGRGFAALEIAIYVQCLPVTYVEPRRWQKELFEGIDQRLKPKEQSLIAGARLLPYQFGRLPKKKTGKPYDGALDALLIAEYGRRRLGL